ncbi:hypothetical protein GDO78_017321, partial [Eleutherodactylus coqui]
ISALLCYHGISMEYYWIILMLPAFFHTSHGNCGAPPRLDFAELNAEFIDKDNFSVGETVTYGCQPGFSRDPKVSNIVTCLNDSTWSTTGIFCIRRSCGNPGEPINGKASIDDTLFGSRVNYTCDPGYNMISKKDYRECMANGQWSNEVPVCEVQKCPPPDAIPDGTFRPDMEEYEYQNAVTYECNDKNAALIGHKTLVCTTFGNWSSDPPRCKEVNCESPNVDNAEKLSGFNGPYTLNSAVSFRCSAGYTMIGSSSVKCNATSQWEPPLPVCSGNNVGAIVGNTLVIFTMSVMALVINNVF